MAWNRGPLPHPVASAVWSSAGTISMELSPKPFTITRMIVVVRANVTTTTVTAFSDLWDRVIANLSLSGAGKTFFNFTNMRAAYHFSRFAGFGPRRPTLPPNSLTTSDQQFMYVFHFGVRPRIYDPVQGVVRDNPWDLTAGIPPTSSGNLTLNGTWGATSDPGTNVSIINTTRLYVYFYGVQPEAGDAPAAYMPQAIPIWQMRTPTPTATSSSMATQDNVPAGDFLHDIMVMQTNGTNAPRDDSMLNSFQVYNQLESKDILTYGGFSGAVLEYKAAELISQFGLNPPPSDNVSTAMTAAPTQTPALPDVLHGDADSGLIWLPLHMYATKGGHPLYGVDLRSVATGDLQLRYGVSDATGVTLDMFYRKYQLL